ncbi:hypothetical protein [Archangium sp.]|uniref:hypothetical protein n=1 Tax=Archangium sp. TaxID=1872627 RepID=UPI0038998242
MTFKTLASATLLFTLAPLTLASAQSSTYLETVVFEAVDSYASADGRLSVTGIVTGEATPRTLAVDINYSFPGHIELGRSCERLTLMAMTKPGQYLLQVSYYNYGASDHPLSTCRLTRR